MSNAAGFVPALMMQCLVSLPLILVWLVGGVMVAMRARNNPTAAYMALGGVVLAALAMALGLVSSVYAPLFMLQGGSAASLGAVISALGVVRTLIGAVSWGLILAALAMALGRPADQDGPLGDD